MTSAIVLPSMTRPRHALSTYASFALFAAVADLASKFAMSRALVPGDVHPIVGRFSLLLTYNLGGAGGVTVGPYTWHVNVLVTALALTLISAIVRQLAQVDPRSSVALGLVAGGAIGNMASMLFGPAGVADFLAIRVSPETTIVMNVADAALWGGALLLVPVVKRLAAAIRAERREPARRLVRV